MPAQLPVILLTGATGFVGSHLLKTLTVIGYRVIIILRNNSSTARISSFLGSVIVYNIDHVPLDSVFKENPIDIVIHLATHYGRKGESISAIAQTNLIFGLNLLDEALAHGVSLFINTDTFYHQGSVISEHLQTYSLSKKNNSSSGYIAAKAK